jgi:hypothetical protein
MSLKEKVLPRTYEENGALNKNNIICLQPEHIIK